MHAFLRPVFVLAAMLMAAGSAAGGPPGPDVFEWKKGKTRKIDRIEYVVHAGERRDFKGARLRWTGEGDCNQKEGQKPIIEIQGPGVMVRNATIVESPDGIHVNAADAVIENIVFPKVCEDAITANGADNLIIRGCAFRKAKDKAIQLNGGRNIVIEDCYFEECAKPVRVKAGATVTVRNCVATDATAFVLADGEGAVVRVENNRVDRSEWFLKAQKRAIIKVGGGNKTRRIGRRDDASDGGIIVGSGAAP